MLKSFADGRLFGTTWGEGTPTVLALHGWRRTHADFTGVFAPGTSGTPAPPAALGVDLAGFGATPPPPDPWSSADYARSLLGLFDEPGRLGDRVTVLGHSFGGRVALHLAGLVPDRIDRMVLTGVPLLARQGRRARPAAVFRLARRLHRMGLVGEGRMEAMRQKYGSPDYRAATGVMRAVFVGLLAEDYAPAMAAVPCPVALVWGEDDTEVPVEVVTRARPLFGEATLEVLPGVGHLTPTEAPGALRRAAGWGA